MLITISRKKVLSKAGFENNPGSIQASHALWIDWYTGYRYSKFMRKVKRRLGFKNVANIDTTWQEREKTGIWWDGD